MDAVPVPVEEVRVGDVLRIREWNWKVLGIERGPDPVRQFGTVGKYLPRGYRLTLRRTYDVLVQSLTYYEGEKILRLRSMTVAEAYSNDEDE